MADYSTPMHSKFKLAAEKGAFLTVALPSRLRQRTPRIRGCPWTFLNHPSREIKVSEDADHKILLCKTGCSVG